jgi:hypothetical protein
MENIKIKWLRIAKQAMKLVVIFGVLVGTQAYANNESTLNQTINDGTLAVDIVDSTGTTVASPSVAFGAKTFSFSTQDATATLGTNNERIRAYNPTSTATWTVSLAGSATTDLWTDGSKYFDFNDGSGYTDGSDDDSYGGQLTVDPSTGTIAGVSGCSTTNVTKGSSNSYDEDTVDSIDLMSAASGAATYCRWDLTGVGLTQKIPSGQVSGNYSITMVLTIS